MKHQWTEDGLTCKAAVVKDNVIKIKVVSGYCIDVDLLLKLKDTGSGLIAKCKVQSSNLMIATSKIIIFAWITLKLITCIRLCRFGLRSKVLRWDSNHLIS